VEELILLVFITWLSLPKMPVKFAAILVVIALNYLISKFVIFKKKKLDGLEEYNDG
jgi:putative flippase GtrA